MEARAWIGCSIIVRFTAIARCIAFFFFSSRRRHTRFDCDWSSDVCSSDLQIRQEFNHLSENEALLSDLFAEVVKFLSNLAVAAAQFVGLLIAIQRGVVKIGRASCRERV